jgi:2-polyprenyl-3-methyl-5-hydroxy-6-metoxy-1,4-benzoquinol methylase
MSSEPKPKHLAPEYGAQFGDESIVAAYRHRPPYPAETFDIVAGLLGDGPRVILEAGCGSGDLALGLARHVERVDAVDPSAAMLTAAQSRPGETTRGCAGSLLLWKRHRSTRPMVW